MPYPDRPGTLDVVIVILSPLFMAVLTLLFLLGFWADGLWRWVTNNEVDG